MNYRTVNLLATAASFLSPIFIQLVGRGNQPPPLPQYIDPIAIVTRSVSTNTHSCESPARVHVLVFRFNFSGESTLKAACQLPPERRVTDFFVPFPVYSVETFFPSSLFLLPVSNTSSYMFVKIYIFVLRKQFRLS